MSTFAIDFPVFLMETRYECYVCEGKRKSEAKRLTNERKLLMITKQNKSQWDYVDKEECPKCQKRVKELDEESGVCKRCKWKYE
jgi:hypothetical protein